MSFSFGTPKTTGGLTFGTASPTTAKPAGFSFGAAPATANPPAFGASPGASSFSFGTPKTTASTSPFGGGLGFGAPAATQAPAGFSFGSPQTTQAQSAFGFKSPTPQTTAAPAALPFGLNQPSPSGGFAFAAKPVATTTSSTISWGTSPGLNFGQAPATAQQATTGLSFGQAATTTPQAAFGQAAPVTTQGQALSFVTPNATLATTPGFGFGGAPPVFGQTAPGTAAPAFGQTPASPTSAFGQASATPAPAFGHTTANPAPPAFGQTTISPAPAFGQVGQTAAPTIPFGQNAAAPKMGQPAATSAPTTGLSFNLAPASTAATSLNFGSTLSTTTPGLNFGQNPANPTSAPSGFSLGGMQQPTSTTPGLAFNLAASTQATNATTSVPTTSAPPAFGLTSQMGTGLAFTSKPATISVATTAVPTSAAPPPFSFQQPSSQPSVAPTGTVQPKPAITGLPSLAATSAPASAPSAAPSQVAPASLAAPQGTTASTVPSSQPALTGFQLPGATSIAPTTTVTSSSAVTQPTAITSMNFGQLEESINKWSLELEEQEKVFINQATQVNAWDKLLIANGDKIVGLNEMLQNVRTEQQSLEHEMDFVISQQRELEELLVPLEKELGNVTITDPEREHTYQLADSVDTQLKQMSEDLKEIIEHLNESNRSDDNNDPIVQIGKILNAHISSMQWIDSSTAQISSKLEQLSAMHNTLRRDNERSFHLTYN